MPARSARQSALPKRLLHGAWNSPILIALACIACGIFVVSMPFWITLRWAVAALLLAGGLLRIGYIHKEHWPGILTGPQNTVTMPRLVFFALFVMTAPAVVLLVMPKFMEFQIPNLANPRTAALYFSSNAVLGGVLYRMEKAATRRSLAKLDPEWKEKAINGRGPGLVGAYRKHVLQSGPANVPALQDLAGKPRRQLKLELQQVSVKGKANPGTVKHFKQWLTDAMEVDGDAYKNKHPSMARISDVLFGMTTHDAGEAGIFRTSAFICLVGGSFLYAGVLWWNFTRALDCASDPCLHDPMVWVSVFDFVYAAVCLAGFTARRPATHPAFDTENPPSP